MQVQLGLDHHIGKTHLDLWIFASSLPSLARYLLLAIIDQAWDVTNGASREVHKDLFGVLAKIPFFPHCFRSQDLVLAGDRYCSEEALLSAVAKFH